MVDNWRRPLWVSLLIIVFFLVSCSRMAGWAGDEPVNDLDLARQVLVQYFSLLHDQRYDEAVHFYGGSYEVLQEWNPDMPSSDQAAMFQQACERNGLMCLEISNFISMEELPDGYRFTVEFTTDEGELLVIGSCCDASDADAAVPRQSHFKFTVTDSGDGFLVQELPVYVP